MSEEIEELEDKIEGLTKRAQTERAEHMRSLHAQWVDSGYHKDQLAPLLKEFHPLINQKTTEWSSGARQVNPMAVRAAITNKVVEAFKTYDPTKAGLNTHVQTRIKGALRDVIAAQNIARIPEEDAFRIGDINRAKGLLSDQLGRDPTHHEIASHLGLDAKRVQRIIKRQVPDVASGSFESDPLGSLVGRDREIIPLLRPQLQEKDRPVFDHIYHPTDPVLSTGVIAKKLGVSDSDVARAKSRIWTVYQGFKLHVV